MSIRESIHDVKLTLLIALGLVIAIIFVFLRSVTATIIPSLTLPVSLVATFAVMYLLNYSLDNLSLMALTLCIGFVVDDTIVMLENIGRHMEMGKPAMRAAFDGAKEVEFTIIAMTVSLVAVFIPVLFMGGIVGRLLQEFAVTIGVAILVSCFVSISLTPMLCSRFLKTSHGQKHGRLYNLTERMFDGSLRAVRRHAAVCASGIAPSRWRSRCCWWSRRRICSRSFRRAFCRSKIRVASTSASRRSRASAMKKWFATSRKSRRSSRRIPTSQVPAAALATAAAEEAVPARQIRAASASI